MGRRIGGPPGRDVVLTRGQQKCRRLDFSKVDRDAGKLNAARLRQQVPLIHVPQIERVHGGRHASGVRVPIEEIERNGLLPEQVIVHDEGPNQVVRAKHVK